MSDPNIDAFLINIAAGVVLSALIAALKGLYGRLTHRNPAYRKQAIVIVGIFWICLNTAFAYFFRSGTTVVALLISSAAMAWIVYAELNQFWRIGLVGADSEIRTGIDFQKSLAMVSNSLDFLGIGAAKLTSEGSAFEAAISRCQRPERPVRFLLCRPDHVELEKMAQSADQERESYKKRVTGSLLKIAELKNGRAWSVQVRFYDTLPIFRLMFVDDSVCLASHYVLGKGFDTKLPQLHVVKRRGSRDIDSLYYAFNAYFERFWEAAEEWDFKRYLVEQ
jgi:hypothetical protein